MQDRPHLKDSGHAPLYGIEDKDGDGFIDLPDIDADGVWGNTTYKYDEAVAQGLRYVEEEDKSKWFNVNPIKPPKFVKILGNKGGYKYYAYDTGINSEDEEKRIPCTSKKAEFKLEKTGGAIDCVISFEELQAFFDARNINITELEGVELNDASYYGRIFARSGGISKGLVDVALQNGVDGIKPVAMSGLADCNAHLLKLKFGKSEFNFFEGMACDGGCMNGALCLHHGTANAVEIENYGKEAHQKDIMRSVDLYNNPRKEY